MRIANAEVTDLDLSGMRFRNVNLEGAKIMEAMLLNARISGLITGLVVNDVEVAPLIDAELDRRFPERTRLRPTSGDGAREAMGIVEDLWHSTRERACRLPEALLRKRVDDEWSFLETARHLVFVTDLWIGGNLLGRTEHYHPLGMPPSFMTDSAALGLDPDADPSAAEILAVRGEKLAFVRATIDQFPDGDLEERQADCLHTYFNEEWHHTWYANRDLSTLEGMSEGEPR